MKKCTFFHTAIFALLVMGLLRPACSSKFHAEMRDAARTESVARRQAEWAEATRPMATPRPEIAEGIDYSHPEDWPEYDKRTGKKFFETTNDR